MIFSSRRGFRHECFPEHAGMDAPWQRLWPAPDTTSNWYAMEFVCRPSPADSLGPFASTTCTKVGRWLRYSHVTQDRHQMIDAVAVDRPDVVETNPRIACRRHLPRVYPQRAGAACRRLWQMRRDLLIAWRMVKYDFDEKQLREISAHRATLRNRHCVGENDDQFAPQTPALFMAHKHPALGAVADHCNDVLLPPERSAPPPSEASGDRCRASPAKRVVFAFGCGSVKRRDRLFGECRHTLAAGRQNFMRIALMAQSKQRRRASQTRDAADSQFDDA